jgi:hypothetical protein
MIENSNFILGEIPKYHPVVQAYERKHFWSTQKRRCIEGYWVGGKWMPGPLYYYVNFHKILFEDESSVSQTIGLPWLRDIDWELFLLYEECRGFSGFSDDKKFTCDRRYGPEKELSLKLGRITPEELKSKEYVPARDYLRRIHDKDLGKPLYKNGSKHFISIQSRGGGKSYSTSGICNHNFIFDGATDYDVYLENKRNNTPTASDTIIGAIDTKYTEPLIKKCRTSMDFYDGQYRIGDKIYHSPLIVDYHGSLAPNRELISKSQSVLRHRTFKDNPLAANGTRPNLCALDEVGFMNNILESWAAIEATQQSKQKKNLVIWALGTGGLVSGKAALYAETVFRNPDQYNCITFDDIYENRGSIGYFVPYSLTLNEFKDGPNKETNIGKALTYVEERRKIAKEGDIKTYYGEIINGPLVPSEAFLTVEGSFFPTLLLKEQLSRVEGGDAFKYMEASFKGKLVFKDDEVDFETIQDISPIREFPLTKDAQKGGCVEVWAKPFRNDQGVIPHNMYIGGMDVVDKDKSTTDSLPSIFIMNRLTRQIVAEYTGRTEDRKDFYEICRRLLKYYNATGMYEQNLPGLFTYFEQKKCLHLLADTPYQLRNAETFKIGGNTSKGVTAGKKVNSDGRQFVKSWLLEKVSTNSDERILNKIYSPALLKELITWNPDGNFDRVSALIMLMWHDETMYREQEERTKEVKTFLDADYWKSLGVMQKIDKFAKPSSDYYYDN